MDIGELARRASPFSEVQTRLFEHEQRMRALIDPPALRWLRESEQQWHRLAEFDRVSQQLRESERIRELLAPSPAVVELQAFEQRRVATIEAWRTPIVELTQRLAQIDGIGAAYSRINQTVLDRIDAMRPVWTATETAAKSMTEVGAVIREMQDRTSATLDHLLPLAAKDYSGIAAGFDMYVSAMGGRVDSMFTALPQREFFVSADLVSRLAGRALSHDDIDAEPRVVRRRIDLYIYETLDEALTDFAPHLLSPMAGARQIATSNNPEKIRYACVSLRTVSLGVLELLAPTNEVKQWSTRPRDFYNGKPRTLTRLRFIAQQIGSPELARFMEADSQAVCELLDVLHAGTHETGVDLDLRQLRYLFRRVESFLCALVEAALLG